jgi:hypothetical protein
VFLSAIVIEIWRTAEITENADLSGHFYQLGPGQSLTRELASSCNL